MKRPPFVWMIAVYYGISAVWTLAAFLLASAGIIWMDKTADAFWAGLTMWEILVPVGEGLLTISAVIALFFLKTVAFRLFLAIWILDTFEYFRIVFSSPFVERLDPSEGIVLFLSYALISLVVYYTYRLKKNRILTD